MIGMMALALAGATHQDLPAMKIEPVPDKGYRMTVASFAKDLIDTVQAQMNAVAARQCGKLTVRWGKFAYDINYPEGVATIDNYKQTLNCIDPATDPFKPAPAGWQANKQDNADALAFLRRYLTAFEVVDTANGVRMMEPIAEITADEWSQQPQTIAAVRGKGSRNFYGPVWQTNPVSATHPGAYAVVGFKGQYEGLDAYCGVFTLYRRGPGDYQVSQQTVYAVSTASVRSGQVSPEAAQQACAFLS